MGGESVEAQMAALNVELRAVIRRMDDQQVASRERHNENITRLSELGARIDVVDMKVTKTNGLVADAHTQIAAQQGQIDTNRGEIARLISTSTGVVKVSDLKTYVAWGFGCGGAAVAATLWVLKVAGKL